MNGFSDAHRMLRAADAEAAVKSSGVDDKDISPGTGRRCRVPQTNRCDV